MRVALIRTASILIAIWLIQIDSPGYLNFALAGLVGGWTLVPAEKLRDNLGNHIMHVDLGIFFNVLCVTVLCFLLGILLHPDTLVIALISNALTYCWFLDSNESPTKATKTEEGNSR